MAKNPPANAGAAGDSGLIPESGRSSGGGNSNQFLPGRSHGLRNLVCYSPWGPAVKCSTPELYPLHGVLKTRTRQSTNWVIWVCESTLYSSVQM